MIKYTDSKRIKQLFITKNIEPTQALIKPIALVTFNFKHSLTKSIRTVE